MATKLGDMSGGQDQGNTSGGHVWGQEIKVDAMAADAGSSAAKSSREAEAGPAEEQERGGRGREWWAHLLPHHSPLPLPVRRPQCQRSPPTSPQSGRHQSGRARARGCSEEAQVVGKHRLHPRPHPLQ
jgi:hypothetical protein